MASTTTPLPGPRLVVTGHASDGTSVFTFDDTRKPFAPFGPASVHFTSFHATATMPASNTAPFPELAGVLPHCPSEGVLFAMTDYPPGGAVPLMHRTQTLDYAVVLSGEIVLSLDGGEEKTVKTGEMMVQRGANHAWINRTNEVCRILFVMVGAEKIVLEDGTALEETVFGKKPE
ncbi:hypothetical protein C8R43DRAFT_1177217 [Mycena crocata]|nr:hypothetical protein C8R43DRAFT_1177217 [Mycena crocata]